MDSPIKNKLIKNKKVTKSIKTNFNTKKDIYFISSLKLNFWNIEFLLLLVSSFILLIIFESNFDINQFFFNLLNCNRDIDTFLKIIACVFFIFTYIFFTKNIVWGKFKDTYFTYYHSISILFFSLITISYFLAKIKKYEYAAYLIIINFIIILASFLIYLIKKFFDLDKEKKTSFKYFKIIVYYVSSSIILILIFAILYSIFNNGLDNNYLITINENITLNSNNDYLYFSSCVFYSSAYGEIYPTGNTLRLLTQLELIISSIIHIIILGKAVEKL